MIKLKKYTNTCYDFSQYKEVIWTKHPDFVKEKRKILKLSNPNLDAVSPFF